MVEHCGNNGADRALGDYWERVFCYMAATYGRSFTPLQIGRNDSAQAACILGGRWHKEVLPDVTIWTHPGQHHEIKHKNPSRDGYFGLELYRFEALMWFAEETQQDVMYTIHNHDLSGGRDARENHIEHWFTVNVRELDGHWAKLRSHYSYYNGERTKTKIRQYFWSPDLWVPLQEYWQVPVIAEVFDGTR